jgi:hypothetical protein
MPGRPIAPPKESFFEEVDISERLVRCQSRYAWLAESRTRTWRLDTANCWPSRRMPLFLLCDERLAFGRLKQSHDGSSRRHAVMAHRVVCFVVARVRLSLVAAAAETYCGISTHTSALERIQSSQAIARLTAAAYETIAES